MLAEPELAKLTTKKKYQGLFDIGVLSLFSESRIKDKGFSQLFKDKAPIYCETGDYLVCLSKEKRVEYRKELLKWTAELGWNNVAPAPFKHHFLFEANNPEARGDAAGGAE